MVEELFTGKVECKNLEKIKRDRSNYLTSTMTAKRQEQLLIESLKNNLAKGWNMEQNPNDSSRLGSLYGDIIVWNFFYNYIYRLEVKCSDRFDSKYFLGCIGEQSFNNFAATSDEHYYYIVFNYDGSDYLFVNAKKLYSIKKLINWTEGKDGKYINTKTIKDLYEKYDLT